MPSAETIVNAKPPPNRALEIAAPQTRPGAAALVRADWSFEVRGALDADSDRIAALIAAHADSGGTLRRSVEEVHAAIGEFVIAEGVRPGDGAPWLAACGALAVFSPALAEIRSVAVDPDSQGAGLGRLVVERLVDVAESMEIDRVVLLTQTPGFFQRCGFGEVDAEFLPVDFIEEAIIARGRTCRGRAIMLRSLS
ncbi:MAG: GNAT family N-acetyltransferase [Planctomycetota bacterium]